MIEIAVALVVALHAGWAYLLYRLHRRLAAVDPALSERIGKPSLFWTPFNGHADLVRLVRRRDPGNGRYAVLEAQIRLMRVWAVATIAATAWMLWVYAHTPAAAQARVVGSEHFATTLAGVANPVAAHGKGSLESHRMPRRDAGPMQVGHPRP